MKLMPFSRPSIGTKELAAVQSVFESGWLGFGELTVQFENELMRFLDPSCHTSVVAVNTGTTALHLALEAVGIRSGDEVILPALTFVAPAQVVTALGATPVFCDVQEDTLNLDPADLARCFSARTRAVIPVHLRGQACDMAAILAACQNKSVRVIEDAAHAFGSRYKDQKVGGFGDLTCFSFDPIKNITCGEGGAITTRDAEFSELLKRKRMLGINKSAWSRQKKGETWLYDVSEQGFRYHMPNTNAAIGLVQLRRFEKLQGRKNQIAQIYDKTFHSLPGLKTIATNHQETSLFNYTLRVLGGKRGDLMEFLAVRGIGSGINYIPVHHFTFFQPLARRPLPTTDLLYDQILTLPLFADMTDMDIERVTDTVKQWTLAHS